MRRLISIAILAGSLAIAASCGRGTDDLAPVRIDDGSPAAWTAHPADGVEMSLAGDDGALRLDFRFTGGGYAIARREVDLVLPENFAFTFRLRGECPVNTLEFKLVDETGENVWWHVKRDYAFPRAWTGVTVKKRNITFAWGPDGDGALRRVSAIEIVVTASEGGAGSVWIDDLTLVPLPPQDVPPSPPVPRASSGDAAAALDGDPATAWSPDATDRAPAVTIDLVAPCEFGGLVLDWAPGGRAAAYVLEISDDGEIWRELLSVSDAAGARDRLYLPESEARHLRLRPHLDAASPPPALAELRIMPLSWSSSREAFYAAVAAESPRGSFPRAVAGEQSYWTVVGADASPRDLLFNEDGQLETGPYRGSVEPFLRVDGALTTWADVAAEHWLADACLPIPSVRWRAGDVELTVTVVAPVEPDARGVFARYRLANRGATAHRVDLDLAIRPFQVNPPSQTLNRPGGAARAVHSGKSLAEIDPEPTPVLGPDPRAAFYRKSALDRV
ncbi:discoidin domain-containing protein, partial [bacterium]|nr:discoidin domain-containing protein [bacterium]